MTITISQLEDMIEDFLKKSLQNNNPNFKETANINADILKGISLGNFIYITGPQEGKPFISSFDKTKHTIRYRRSLENKTQYPIKLENLLDAYNKNQGKTVTPIVLKKHGIRDGYNQVAMGILIDINLTTGGFHGRPNSITLKS